MKCKNCGAEITDGYVWHGKKYDTENWVKEYGQLCYWCTVAKQMLEKKPKQRTKKK